MLHFYFIIAKHDLVIALRREIAHLRNFSVKEVSSGDNIDGTVNLECSLGVRAHTHAYTHARTHTRIQLSNFLIFLNL